MTLSEARGILGLGPDDDPRPHLAEFRIVRERIAEMVRTAPNNALAERYQAGLMEFDRALAAVREYLEALGLAVPVAAVHPAATVIQPEPAPALPRRKRAGALWVTCIILLLLAVGAGWYYLKMQELDRLDRQARVAGLEAEGAGHIENRRWPEAMAAFEEIERLAPASPVVPLGRRSIEAGMAEEQQQFGGYWTGQARAALEAGRFDEAVEAVRMVLDKFPKDAEAAAMMTMIADARADAALAAARAAARNQLDQRQWDAAIAAAQAILAGHPGDSDTAAILADATAAKVKAAADLAKARGLFQQAAARDHGQFDPQALEWLREAAALAPDDHQITELLEKMASYTRTLRVPGDFATPAEALAQARERDRIVIAEGTWQGPLVINVPIELQGAGPDKTRIECHADAGCVIALGPAATGSRLTGIGFRHVGQSTGAERYSAALVRGALVEVLDCHFCEAGGHGLAAIEGGKVNARRCRFADNGWNGVTAFGAGCRLELRDSQANGNFEHGIETWQGAAAVLLNNRCEGNSRNGIHADNAAGDATIDGNQLLANREFGLVLAAAGSGSVRGNTASANLLGGFVIRAAARVAVTGNQLTKNQGPGLTLEAGLNPASYTENTLSNNTGRPVISNFTFPPATREPSR